MRLTPLEQWIMNKTGIKERDKNALVDYQLAKIRETMSYAKKNSVFYGKLLKNVREESVYSQESFQHIPLTYPQDIMRSPLDFLCVPQRKVARIVTLNTSGTSGEEKRLFFTEEDLDLTVDFFRYGMSCLVDETDKVLVLMPGNTYGSIGDLLKKALALSGIECIAYGVLNDPEDAAKCIQERDITCIVGIPLQVLYLSRVKSDIFRNKIKKVLLSTDYVPEVLINELTQKFGCRVFSHYGMTEMGYGGGVECEALSGYHMRDGDMYFEIINPDTGKAVEKGQYGEVVFTTLTRQAMPLIRYRTGDIASFSPTECACGTFLNTMKKVLGRIENRVRIGEERFLYLRELDETILPFEEVLDYRACLKDKDRLILEVVVKDNIDSESIKDKIMQNVRNLLPNQPMQRLNVTVVSAARCKPVRLTNSMVKRKIIDYRGGINIEGHI
ncbi:MAG: phenylacetate--CoA ligase family protein [Gracilibacteraceae bacterium]|jgi:phenylacetate-CoA ligase|nr:phenylacetate--CoA ligase family protein [Gracilibacteraceae bacterium]